MSFTFGFFIRLYSILLAEALDPYLEVVFALREISLKLDEKGFIAELPKDEAASFSCFSMNSETFLFNFSVSSLDFYSKVWQSSL